MRYKLFLCIFLLSISPLHAETDSDRWLSGCLNLKKHTIATPDFYNTIFTPLPKPQPLTSTNNWSVINWNNRMIPIPLGKIKKINVTQGEQGSFFLAFEDGTTLIFSKFHPNFNLDKDQVEASKKEQIAFYGKPTTLFESQKLQYSTQGEQLDCLSKDVEKNKRIYFLLVLKKNERPHQAVHQDINGLESIVEYRPADKYNEFNVTVPNKDAVIIYSYRIPKDKYETLKDQMWTFGSEFTNNKLPQASKEILEAFNKFNSN